MSNNLNLDQVAAGQTQKEVTINDQSGQLDAALTEQLAVDLTSGNVVLTDTQFRRNLNFTITATVSSRTLTVSAIKKLFMATSPSTNTESFSVVRGATSFSVDPGTTVVFYTDGTTDGLFQVAGTGSGNANYEIAGFLGGVPSNSELVVRHVPADAITLPEDLTGSQGVLGVAATAQTDFDIQKNGGSIGTMRFAAAGTVASFIFSTTTNFNAGDTVEVVAPSSADSTAADLSFTLLATRQ